MMKKKKKKDDPTSTQTWKQFTASRKKVKGGFVRKYLYDPKRK